MAASKLTWVYGPTHRAKDVSNETLDEYQGIIRQLYLNQNMTRDEVLGHLKHVHGFTLSLRSPSQFSKATKRWGLYKQLRQDRTSARAPKTTIVQELGQLGEVFDIEVDVSDAVGEQGIPFQTGSRFILDSTDLKTTENKSSFSKRDTQDQQPRSINHSQRQPPIFADETLISPLNSGFRMQGNLEMVIENESLHRPMSPQGPQQRKACFEPTEGSIFDDLDHSLLPKRLRPGEHDDENMFADYLTCCYIYNDSFDYLERIVAMRTFLCPQEISCQHVNLGFFLDRLDADEEEFAHLIETCLGVYTIEDFISTSRLSPRDIKREFLQHFIKHHEWSTLEPEDNGAIKRVQKYQRAALGLVHRCRTGTVEDRTSVQEPRQMEIDSFSPLHTNIAMTNSGSLASSKATNSTSRSTSSSRARQLYLSSLTSNPTISRSLASGSSRGSSLNSFRRFQAASAAITIRLKEPQDSHMQSLNEQDTDTWSDMDDLV
ncbi:hypothetical protein FALBO_15836 [Fusarium albosuccineum]|uniref:Clr5 domain-containing protein n=1 Tax=Fusarium albosuccineum TaxID=1237068 RepID=A0A8H4P0B9_9HYPO|nr:hypothetical protein FALBO_15836 [Fusarium albosuccineum]